MLTWMHYAQMPDSELKRHDLAKKNIVCAFGLPGTKDLDPEAATHRCDEMARQVRYYTDHRMFERNRAKWDGSYSIFRMHVMMSVLQREFGVRYNPAKRAPDAPFGPEDTFLQGILWGDGGTCGTLPVLYASVGRRLGYPLKLVSCVAKKGSVGHLFCRWDDPAGERFNIETTAEGLCVHPDDYYRTGEYAVSSNDEKHAGLLKSKTPQEEMSGFIAARGLCWLDTKEYPSATTCLAWAYGLAPANKALKNRLIDTLNEWGEVLLKLRPTGFPEMVMYWPARLLPEGMPVEMERDLIVMNARHKLLTNPEYEASWWKPMRQGKQVLNAPTVVEVKGEPGWFDMTLHLRSPCPQPYLGYTYRRDSEEIKSQRYYNVEAGRWESLSDGPRSTGLYRYN